MLPLKPTVDSKAEYYLRWERGDFGNRPRNWQTLKEALDDPYGGAVSIRYSVPGSPWHRSAVPKHTLAETVNELKLLGADERLLRFNENPPDDQLLLQGEVMRTPCGLALHYSREKKVSLRQGLARGGELANGLVAVTILKEMLTPVDYDDIMELLTLYEGAVVEFSCYSVPVGVCPHRSTLIWEVRHY